MKIEDVKKELAYCIIHFDRNRGTEKKTMDLINDLEDLKGLRAV